MLLDITGTRFYQGKLILPEEWRLDKNRPLQWWMPQGDKTIYKVVVRSIRGEILWQKPFDDLVDALKFQHRFILGERIGDCPSFDMGVVCSVDPVHLFLSAGTQTWHCPDGVTPVNKLPTIFPPGDPNHDPEMWEATSGSFTSSNSTAADWFTGNKAPAGVSSVDYLVVAAGGGGGGNVFFGSGGGGGAGGLKTSTGLSVTPGNAYTVTINTGGAGGGGGTKGSNGGTSVFSSITSTGGGGGGIAGNNALAGGSGGGGGGDGSTNSNGGAGTGSEGNAGGSNIATGPGGAGGGGAGAVGTSSPGTNGTAGGAGTSSSITGSTVTYAGGGGGGSYSGTGGSGGSGGGGNGGSGADGSNGTTNLGGGGGGSGTFSSGTGGTGGTGIVGLTFTATILVWIHQSFNEPSAQTFQVTH